jgi:hypothetical protein
MITDRPRSKRCVTTSVLLAHHHSDVVVGTRFRPRCLGDNHDKVDGCCSRRGRRPAVTNNELVGGAITLRQVRPTTTAACPARPGHPLRTGGIGTSWSWSPMRVVVKHLPKPIVVGEADIDQCLVEAGDRSAVHLLVRTVAAMYPHHRGLIAVAV